MDNTQLETFVAIVNYRNFSKVAERLNVTQPTITNRMKSLEAELNAKLLVRDGKNVTLTKEGETFLEYATKTLNYMNDSIVAVQTCQEPVIRIGFSPGFSISFILEAVKTLKSEQNLTISVIQGEDSVELTRSLLQGELHLVFTRNSVTFESELVSEHLFDDEITFICSKEHRIAKMDEVSVGDLQGETLICYLRDSPIWAEIERNLVGVQNMKRIEVGNNEILKAIVKQGWGVSFILSLGLESEDSQWIATKEIKEIETISNKIYVQYKKNSLTEPYIKKVIYSFIDYQFNLDKRNKAAPE